MVLRYNPRLPKVVVPEMTIIYIPRRIGNAPSSFVWLTLIILEDEPLSPLYSPCNGLVQSFLFSSHLQFLLIGSWGIHCSWISSSLHDVHMKQAVILYNLIIEPWTVTRFPLRTANHAELGSTATGHVITSFFQLNCG